MSLEEERPYKKSKSQRKREVEALQTLGERLVQLKPAELDKIPLSEALREAIDEAKRVTSRSALRRQRQYIGRLMRDADSQAIETAFNKLDQHHAHHTAAFHMLEAWRTRLVEQGDSALVALSDAYPSADQIRLRQLIRDARKEHANGHPPKAYRALFRYLRELMDDG